ncbi:MAG: GTPase Era, partial [Clostridia bacterium]|nr:GTPase Era [Clostridia bacterium]
MVKAVGDGMEDVDCCLLVVEADKKITPAEKDLIEKFKSRKLNAVLAINKIDLLEDKQELFEIIKKYTELFNFSAVVPVSAKFDEGTDELFSELLKFAVPSVHYFDDNSFTDQPERVIAAEMIREKLLCLLDKEIPHGIAVDIERFSERQNSDILDIDAVIYCEKASHKGIIIGKGGAMLKKTGSYARHDLENFFEIKVNLKLWVKVKDNWRTQNTVIHSFGLD